MGTKVEVKPDATESSCEASDFFDSTFEYLAYAGRKDEGDFITLRVCNGGSGVVTKQILTYTHHGVMDPLIKGPLKVCGELRKGVTV